MTEDGGRLTMNDRPLSTVYGPIRQDGGRGQDLPLLGRPRGLNFLREARSSLTLQSERGIYSVVYLSFRKFELLYPPHPCCGRKFSTVTLRAAAGGEAIPLSARRLLSPRSARDMRYARNDRRQRFFHGFRATRCEFPERMIQYRQAAVLIFKPDLAYNYRRRTNAGLLLYSMRRALNHGH